MSTVDLGDGMAQAGQVSIVGRGGSLDESLRLALGPRSPADETATDAALLRAAQRGSGEAVESLFRRHWRRCHRAADLILRDADAAEDIAQEAFLAAMRSLDRFDRRRPFSPWLHRIVVNRAIDHARARASRREVGEEMVGETAAGEVRGGLDPDLAAALRSLDPEQRAVIVLRHLLDYRPGEIAKMLGLPRGTVNSRLRRGLDRLADSLEGVAR